MQNHELVLPESLYGIIGFPLKQSLSPYLHNLAFKIKSLPCAYFSWEIPSSSLAEFMLSMRSIQIQGLSVTIPHKQNIIPFLDKLTAQAQKTQAVNTLFWKDGLIWGENTDCKGFVTPLKKKGIKPGSALILGGGGAALACLNGLKELGTEKIYITLRDPDKALKTMKESTVLVPWEKRQDIKADILVNATPLGMLGALEKELPFPEENLSNFKIVYELIYNPLNTLLLNKSKDKKLLTISGLEMFIHQGLEQLKIWTGIKLDPEKIYNLLSQRLIQQSRG